MRSSHIILVLSLLFGSACIGPRAAQDAQTHRKMGVALLTEGNAGGAVTELKAAVKKNPWDADAWHELGLAWFAVKKYDDAEQCLKKSLSIRENHSQARLNLGSLYLELGRFDEAVPLFEAAAADPEYREPGRARHNLGWALQNLGQADRAREQYYLVLREHPRFCPSLHNLAMLDESAGKDRDALDRYRDAHSCNPREASSLLALGLLEAKLDLVADACAHLGTVIDADPYGPLKDKAAPVVDALDCKAVSSR